MNERMRLGLDIVTDRRDIYIIIASRPVRWFITGGIPGPKPPSIGTTAPRPPPLRGVGRESLSP